MPRCRVRARLLWAVLLAVFLPLLASSPAATKKKEGGGAKEKKEKKQGKGKKGKDGKETPPDEGTEPPAETPPAEGETPPPTDPPAATDPAPGEGEEPATEGPPAEGPVPSEGEATPDEVPPPAHAEEPAPPAGPPPAPTTTAAGASTTRERLLPRATLVYSIDFDECSKIDHEMLGAPQAAGFSPDGRYLCVGGKTKVVRFFDAKNGKYLAQAPPHHLPIGGHRAISWSDDSRYCFATGSDHVIWMWSPLLKFGCDRVLRGGIPNETICIDYSPKRRMVVSGGSTGSLQVWDITRPPHGNGNGVVGVGDRSISPPVAAHSISEAEAGGHSKNVLDVAWDPSGTRFAAGGWMALQIFDAVNFGPPMAPGSGMSKNWWGNISKDFRGIPIHSLRVLKEFPVPADGDETGKLYHRVAWSPDGRRLAVGLGVGKENAHDGRHRATMPISIYDTSTWTVVKQWMAHPTRVYALEWSPDGSVLASGGGNEAAFWNPDTGQKLLSITDARDEVSEVAWSSSGEWVVVCPGSERHDSPGPNFKFPGKDHLARIYKVVRDAADAPGPPRAGPPVAIAPPPPPKVEPPRPPAPPAPKVEPPKQPEPDKTKEPPKPPPELKAPSPVEGPPVEPPKQPPPPPTGSAAALLAEAEGFEKGSKWAEARERYDQVARKYPSSQEAGKAAEAIDRLWREHGADLLQGIMRP